MITVEQTSAKGLMVFGRNEDGKRYSINIEDFEPYFFDNFKNKIIADSSGDVKDMREQYPNTYEADINYAQRYIIDRIPLPIRKEPIRKCYLDIVNTPKPIIIIGTYDNYLKKYVIFVLLKKDMEERESEKREDVSIYFFKEEKDLLNKYIEYIIKTDPDMICGWNVDFDVSYIINRAKMLGANVEGLSPIKRVRAKEVDNKYSHAKILGRVVFDLKSHYEKFCFITSNKKPFYNLDYIMEVELGIHKLEANYDDFEGMMEYNLNDLKIKDIDEKVKLVDFWDSLRRVSGCTWDTLTGLTMPIDALILREARSRNVLLPTKTKHIKTEKYKGAYVHFTSAGLKKNVFSVDFASLYPSIMCQFNISFDTIDPNGDIKLGNGINFSSQEEGIIVTILKRLADMRTEYKKLMKEKRGTAEYITYYNLQFAAKVIRNAHYGALGYEKFRMYSPDAASSITWLAREIIKWSIKKSQDWGYNIVYGDTDSMYIEYPKELNIKGAEFYANNLVKKLNETFDDFVKQYGMKKNEYLELAFERIFESVFFAAKKKYIGRATWEDEVLEKPKLIIKGFELKRSDYSRAGKPIQENILNMILDGKTRPEIDCYIEKKKQDLMLITDYDDIVIPKPLNQPIHKYKTLGAHVRGIIYANNYLNENITPGDKVKMLYVEAVKGKPSTDVICYKNKCPVEVKVNWKKMLELIIDNKRDHIYEILGWNTKNESKALGAWFK